MACWLRRKRLFPKDLHAESCFQGARTMARLNSFRLIRN